MGLQVFWFCLIGVLWGGYFLLEGFDFGVGVLLGFLPRDEGDRDDMFESIGPVWDGNEVWLVVAAGATFAAFPTWYGTMFSGFYLALLVILVLLILRAVSFEWRNKNESPRWRSIWQRANTVASIGAPFLWGVALASLLHGTPVDSSHDFTGDVLDLFTPYSILAGLAVVLLFTLHGACYLTLRTSGELRDRAASAARRLAAPAAVVGVAFLAWTVAVAIDTNDRDLFPPVLPAALGAVALALAVVFARGRRTGWAFVMTALGSVLAVATIFTGLYPRVMVSSTDFANSLTLTNAASSHYTLQVMTIAAVILTPVILLYQGWTYYVFRARIGGREPRTPVDMLSSKPGPG